MNSSFENIFKKYNLIRENPRKRHGCTNAQLCNLPKKGLPITTKAEAGNSKLSSSSTNTNGCNFSSSCYYNKNSRTKYNMPTRYNRLELIQVGSKAKLRNCSWTECFPSDRDDHSSEKSEGFHSHVKEKQSNDSITCDANENCSNTQDCLEIPKFLSNNNNDDSLKVNDRTGYVTENSITKSSDCENTIDLSTQNTTTEPSELDLLIDLIEQQSQNNCELLISKHNRKTFYSDERLLVTKPLLKGGCQEMFERCLKHATAKRNFLKYDKKIGLQIGQLLTVVKIQTFHGLTLATVKSHDLNQNVAVVVAREMASYLLVGSRIETFFDENTMPYKLLLNGEYFEVYLDPYKLLLAQRK